MIKVFKVKDLIKYLIKILIVLTAVALVVKFLKIGEKNKSSADVNSNAELSNSTDEKTVTQSNEENNNEEGGEINGEKNEKKSQAWLFCIDDMLPQIAINKQTDQATKVSSVQIAFSSELEVLDSIKDSSNETSNETSNNENNGQGEGGQEISSNAGNSANGENSGLTTQNGDVLQSIGINKDWTVTEVDNSGVNPRYTDEYNGVLINNSTKYTLTQEMLTPDVEVNKSKVAIYHTHTCESYTPTEQYQYTASGNFRTTDLNFSVSRVGDVLESCLNSYGCTVIHDKTYHDYPAYNGSYSRSLVTAQNILSANPDTDIVIDLHRDAIADETYAPKVKIGDEYVSQLMFVMGTDGSNSAHTNWLQNLKFAIKVQQKANELYPGLFKPIILRNSEYNQHVAKAACIIEVGSTGNTLEESMGAMKYLARILEEM